MSWLLQLLQREEGEEKDKGKDRTKKPSEEWSETVYSKIKPR